jgi:hypothetical protein
MGTPRLKQKRKRKLQVRHEFKPVFFFRIFVRTMQVLAYVSLTPEGFPFQTTFSISLSHSATGIFSYFTGGHEKEKKRKKELHFPSGSRGAKEKEKKHVHIKKKQKKNKHKQTSKQTIQ